MQVGLVRDTHGASSVLATEPVQGDEGRVGPPVLDLDVLHEGQQAVLELGAGLGCALLECGREQHEAVSAVVVGRSDLHLDVQGPEAVLLEGGPQLDLEGMIDVVGVLEDAEASCDAERCLHRSGRLAG